jgi:multicomponent Na+:H+ antiporter subunit C
MGELILEQGAYWIIICVMMVGLYIAFSAENLIKRLVGLSLFQTTVCLFYVMLGNVDGGTAPIHVAADMPKVAGERLADLQTDYSNPLPHVLMLTAIVVGVATLSLGLALIVRINEAYGSIEAGEIRAADIETELALEREAAARDEAPR